MALALEPTEVLAPHPFEPAWTARVGPFTQTGKGLLPPPLHSQRGLMNEFIVPCGTFTVKVSPVQGKVWLDAELKFDGVADEGFSLMWFRRMQAEMFTADTFAFSPYCLWYGLGLWLKGNPAWAYRLFEDQHVEPGL